MACSAAGGCEATRSVLFSNAIQVLVRPQKDLTAGERRRGVEGAVVGVEPIAGQKLQRRFRGEHENAVAAADGKDFAIGGDRRSVELEAAVEAAAPAPAPFSPLLEGRGPNCDLIGLEPFLINDVARLGVDAKSDAGVAHAEEMALV